METPDAPAEDVWNLPYGTTDGARAISHQAALGTLMVRSGADGSRARQGQAICGSPPKRRPHCTFRLSNEPSPVSDRLTSSLPYVGGGLSGKPVLTRGCGTRFKCAS